MSAIRLEVETHIVTASATAVQNLTKCVIAGRGQDRRARGELAGRRRGGPVRDREGAGRRGRRHRRRHDRPRPVRRRLAVLHARSCRSAATTSRTTSRSGSRRASRSPRSSRSATARATCGASTRTRTSRSRSSARTPGATVSRLEMCQIIEARMRETFELMRDRDARVRPRHAAGRAHPDRRRRAAGRHGRARPRGPPDAGPDRRAGRRRRAWSTASSPRRTAPPSGCSCGAPASSAAGEPARYESAPAMGGLGRIRDALRSIFP